jgi:hypothetical protein
LCGEFARFLSVGNNEKINRPKLRSLFAKLSFHFFLSIQKK